jgi:hypothetical protein
MTKSSEMSPQDQEDAAHFAVCEAGYHFVHAVWGARNLSRAWPHVDPLLRRCWAQAWLNGQQDKARGDGFEPAGVVDAFTAEKPEHPLWRIFTGLQTDLLLERCPKDVADWSLTARHILVAPDVELLRLLPPPAQGDVAAVGTQFMPLVMRYEPGPGWRVLNFTSENIPVPGWPPTM